MKMGVFSRFSRNRSGHTSTNLRGSFVGDEEQNRGISRAANKLKIGHVQPSLTFYKLLISFVRAEDVVIAIMGVTGTGKSTFIQQLVQSGVKVGHSLRSCTINQALAS
jgi:hypothetical protein